MGTKLRKAYAPLLCPSSYFPTNPIGGRRRNFHWAEYICFMGSSQRVLLLLAFLFLVVFSGCGLFKKGCGDCPKWGKAQDSHFPDRTSS
ncbi:MAG: hypothetical protein RLZZ630_697 [Bacteroidota bacterium]|jgi:hypothetical protein